MNECKYHNQTFFIAPKQTIFYKMCDKMNIKAKNNYIRNVKIEDNKEEMFMFKIKL